MIALRHDQLAAIYGILFPHETLEPIMMDTINQRLSSIDARRCPKCGIRNTDTFPPDYTYRNISAFCWNHCGHYIRIDGSVDKAEARDEFYKPIEESPCSTPSANS